MLSPNQIQDLAVMLNTDPEVLEKVYETSDVELTDEMAIVDILTDNIELKDYSKVKTILQNYPLFDDILYKMNIVEQVQSIEKLNQVSICENLTESVLKSFEGTPLYNIFNEAEGNTIEEKNENIRKKIMETISPKLYLKPIMEGIDLREKKPLLESLSKHDLDLTEEQLIKKIRELRRYMNSLPHFNGKTNSQYFKCAEEIRELEKLYDEKFGAVAHQKEELSEDLIKPIEPIKPIKAAVSTNTNPIPLDDKENKETISQMTDDQVNKEFEDMLDSDKNIDPILLKRAFGDIDTDQLKDLYKDMDNEDLKDHIDAIEEYLK